MLTSLLLTLISDHDATLPAHLGRAAYAATLDAVRSVDPALAAHIHDRDGAKPLVCSGLLGARSSRDNTLIDAGAAYRVRICGLTQATSAVLLHYFGLGHLAAGASFAAEMPLSSPVLWDLDHHPFQVVGAVCDATQESWTGQTTYEELAAASLLQQERLPRQVTLEFASPTAFKSGGVTNPIPLPNLVFGSLVERWNAFSPITLSPEMRHFGGEMVGISRYRLESVAVVQKNAGLRIGGVGRVTYTAIGGDRYWLGVMNMLADFALYSGVGMLTATGMGQCRRVG
jgi:CRISPR-associated endoribonuclease Cas6